MRSLLSDRCVLIAPPAVFPQAKEKVIVLSWGDMIGSDQYRALDTAEGVADAVRAWKAAGISKVAVPGRRLSAAADTRNLRTGSKDYQLWYNTTRKAWDAGILKNAVGLGEAGRHGDPDVDLAL